MDRCVLRIGRIINHPCGRLARILCADCGRPVCREHSRGASCDECRGARKPSNAAMKLEDLDLSTHFDGDFAVFSRPGGPLPDDLHGEDS